MKVQRTGAIYDPRPAIVVGEVAFIPLGANSKDGFAVVDREFAHLADEHKWRLASGYAITKTERRASDLLHHQIIGYPPAGEVVDHINRNKMDNRLRNLRFITRAENMMNSAPSKRNLSGYKGVWFNKGYGKWKAQMTWNKKNYPLGYFDTKEEAINARVKAESEHGITYSGAETHE